ncbi:MAG: sugar-binding transcriptional regulator [Beutenbergiaceae bacterium]
MPSKRNDDVALMTLVAKKYFLRGQTKQEIADQLFLSRFKVARLLDAAQKRGIVEISIRSPPDENAELAAEMRSGLLLKYAAVIDDSEDLGSVFNALGDALVTVLSESMVTGDVVGVSSTRALMGLRKLTAPIPSATFVQLNGQLSRPDAADTIDGIRKLTAHARGTAHVFYAPLFAASASLRRGYERQQDATAAGSHYGRMNIAITGVGGWQEGGSVTYDGLESEVRRQATDAGAVAEILGVPIDADGHTVRGAARERIVAPDAEILHGVPLRIGVCSRMQAVEGARTALRAGLINALVTHKSAAEELLV